MNVLITNVSYHNAVSAIKMCRDIPAMFIIGCSSMPYGYSSGSILVDQFIKTYDIDKGYEYIMQIKKICDDYNIELIISTEDEEQKWFNKCSEYFSGKIVTVNNKLVDLFTNKYDATLAVSKIGLTTPYIYNDDDLTLLDNKSIIIRKKTSCCSYGIKILKHAKTDEIKKYTDKYSFIQDYIEGDEYTVDVLCDIEGNPKNIIPRKRLAIRSGITYKCIIEKNQLLIDACKNLYHNFFIPGFSNTQFIVKEGIAYYIETNLRIGGTTIASSLSGDNLMSIYVEHFLEHKPMKTSKINWGAVITRYYSETILIPEK